LPLKGMGAAPTALPAKAVRVQIAGEVKVGGERIVLGDIAAIYSRSIESFHKLSALELARLPEDSKELRLPASYLEQRIREALPSGTDLELRVPEAVVFHLQRIGWSEQEFAAELARLARSTGKIPAGVEIEVQPLSGFDKLKLLKPEEARIEPAAQLERWKGELSFKISRVGENGEQNPIWVKARVRWFQNAWVATRRTGFAQPLDPSLFKLGRVETTTLREDPLPAASAEELGRALKSSRARRAIAENAPLLSSQVERRPDAMPGQPLRVVFQSENGVSVSAEGALLAPGTIGNEVKARLHSSKKIVIGRLVSEGVVEVSL
jgi:flagella basal body P-ring formation protein FlgA